MTIPPFVPAWHDGPAAVAASLFLALLMMPFGRGAAEQRSFAGRYLSALVRTLALFVPTYVAGQPLVRGAELAGREPGWWLFAGLPAGLLVSLVLWNIPPARRWMNTVGRRERPEDVFT